MTETTWGDFTGIAAGTLQLTLGELLDTDVPCTEGQHAARAQELANVCGRLQPVVHRFGLLAADAGLVTDGELRGLQSGLGALIEELNRGSAFAVPVTDRVAGQLANAARMLALGGDVLASHHTPSGRPQTQYAAYLDSPTAAYEILAEATEMASTAGFTAIHLARLAPPHSRYPRNHAPLSSRVNAAAGQLHRTASSINNRFSFAWPPAAVTESGIGQLSPAPSQPPPPVLSGEPQQVALRAVVAASEWISAQAVRQQADPTPDLTVVELRDMANLSAASHLLGARLIDHTRGLLAADPVFEDAYLAVASALRTSSRAWRAVGAAWCDTFGSIPTGTSPPVLRETEFVTVRLGRTLFASGWTPVEGLRGR